jgi:hypothetical protein
VIKCPGALTLAAVVLVACSPAAVTSPSVAESLESTASPMPAGVVGVWTRTQDCAGQLAAFDDAGLVDSHIGWVIGNWFPEGWEPNLADPCEGARPAEEHSHFFTAAGEFGSYDANGEQVDDGDYVLVDDNTLGFPSHAAEFGYDGDLLVEFTVNGDTATFAVQMPDDCTAACADAYAWALSAFYEADAWGREATQ